MATINVSNRITISNIDIDKGILNYLDKNFSIPNKKKQTMKNMGKRCFYLPDIIRCYERKGTKLIFDRGDYKEVEKFLKEFGIKTKYRENLIQGKKVNFEWNNKFKLRPYQQKAVDIAKYKTEGAIISAAGSGKTIIGMNIVKELGLKTLWLTHTKDLVNQSKERCEQTLGITPGIVGAGKRELDNDVIIATVQTLSRNKELVKEINKDTGLVIVDEVHNCPTSYFQKVLRLMNPRRLYGLTATPTRKDGKERFMYASVGPKIVEVDRSVLYDNDNLVIPELVPVYTEFDGSTLNTTDNAVNLGGEKSNWHGLLEVFKADKERLEFVAETIIRTFDDKSTLVISEWIEYAEKLLGLLKKSSNSNIEFVSGSTSKKERARKLKEFESGDIDILIATKIAEEGLDIPNIANLYITTPKKGDSKKGVADGTGLEQVVGRAMRKDPNNPDKVAKVYDFVDYEQGILKRQWYTRRRTYKRLGIDIPRKPRNTENYIEQVFPGLY